MMFCLLGPTAIGKSELSYKLAEKLSAEIISVDSALIYRGMDIGTAKPSKAILREIPHHLIDIRNPNEKYSVGQFYRDCHQSWNEINARQHTPLLVGGTMMYYQGLWAGLADLPESTPDVRAQLESEKNQKGLLYLYQWLQQVDAASAVKIKPTDPQRIVRALEVFLLTGLPLSVIQQTNSLPPTPKRALAIVPHDRATLHAKIAERFTHMLKHGFLEEVEVLFQRTDLTPDHPSMRAVGYRQAWFHLAGKISYDEMVTQAITATRQLAKRQLTWIRGMHDITVMQDDEVTLNKALAFFQKADTR